MELDDIKLCSYCLRAGELQKLSGYGDLCEICLDSYLNFELETWQQSQHQQTAITQDAKHGKEISC